MNQIYKFNAPRSRSRGALSFVVIEFVFVQAIKGLGGAPYCLCLFVGFLRVLYGKVGKQVGCYRAEHEAYYADRNLPRGKIGG